MLPATGVPTAASVRHTAFALAFRLICGVVINGQGRADDNLASHRSYGNVGARRHQPPCRAWLCFHFPVTRCPLAHYVTVIASGRRRPQAALTSVRRRLHSRPTIIISIVSVRMAFHEHRFFDIAILASCPLPRRIRGHRMSCHRAEL